MNSVRESYNQKINKYMLVALMAHLPIFLIATWAFDSSYFQAIGFWAAIMTGPVLTYLAKPSSNLCVNTMAVAGIMCSGLLIHLGKGMIEMHFHIFIFLACLSVYGLKLPIISATVAVVIHHVGFFFLFPASVFNYDASFGIVLLHAAFVVAEDIGILFIAHNFNKFIISQGTNLGQMEDIAFTNQEDSAQLKESVNSLLSVTHKQASSTTEMNQGINDVQQKVEQNSEELKNSMEMVSDMENQSSSAMSSMNQMTSSMQEINSSVDQLKEIEEIIKTISQKLTLINDIVFKTQLLSFNASIEAARAGQHGRGFSVVAEEVGTLALSSGNASKDIQSLLEESSTKVSDIISSVQTKVGSAVEVSSQSFEKFSLVTGNLNFITEMVSSVGERNQFFLESFGEFQKAISQLQEASDESDQITQQVNKLTENTQKSADQLTDMIETTKKLVA